MDLERITREVEWQVLRDTRSKGAVNRRLDPGLTAATLPGALSLELLCPQCTPERVETLCRGARKQGAAAVTVLPAFVSAGRSALGGSMTALTAAIGYPWGSLTPAARTALTRDCLVSGADVVEIAFDMAALRSGRLGEEQLALEELGRLAASYGAALAVGVDLRLLERMEQVEVLTALRRTGAAMVSLRRCRDAGDVRLARELMGGQMAVKAAGPAEGLEEIRTLLRAGAAQVGVSDLTPWTDEK